MATAAQYDAATKALLKLEQTIVQQKGVPAFLLPSQAQLTTYAQEAAKAAVDAALAVS